MKVIVASFQCESNSRAKTHPQKYDFEYFRGEDIFKKLVVKGEFEKNGIEVVPAVYAAALPSGTVELSVYNYYHDQILETVRENADADGIFIYFHGSMEVEEIGSGELYMLKNIRKIVSDRADSYFKLLDTAMNVGAKTFVCGINYDESISLYKNYVNALSFFLAFSMGASATIAVGFVAYLLLERKGTRGSALVLMVETLILVAVAGFLVSAFCRPDETPARYS